MSELPRPLTISKLTYRRDGGLSVYCGGELLCIVDALQKAPLGLAVGKELTEPELETVRTLGSEFAAHKKAAASLARQSYSRHGLQRSLVRRGIAQEQAEQAVEHFAQRGYLDDAAFALHQAERMQRKGYGHRRIAAHLWEKGVPKEQIETALAQLEPEEYTLADTLSRRFSAVDFTDRAQRDKAVAALLRLGFCYEEIARALRALRCDLPLPDQP